MTFIMPEDFASGNYPASWDEYIGQEKAKQQIRVAAQSAKIRGCPLDHLLIASGTPGIGKTSLALLAAREMEANLRVVSGRITLEGARLLLSDMEDGDVLFIDEAHKLVESGKKDAEWLLHYLQDGYLIGPYSYEEVPQVTVMAATTEAGKLPATIVSRFPLKPMLYDYTEDEAALIALRLASSVLDNGRLTWDNAAALARAGNHNPRAIRQLLVTLRDLSVTGNLAYSDEDGYDIDKVLDWNGIAPDGLDQSAQRYLKILARDFQGKAGQKAIEERLQEPGGLAEVERVLISKQLIAKTASGRTITMAGARRAKEVA